MEKCSVMHERLQFVAPGSAGRCMKDTGRSGAP
jgi:hypothetical protein